MDPIRKIVVDRGPAAKMRIAWGRSASGRYLGEEFFVDECNEDQRSKFEAIFNMAADNGFIKIPKMFRYPLEGCGNLGEFKTFKKRLFFYRDGRDYIITHGATKKTDSTDPNDIVRAERIESEIKAQEQSLQGGRMSPQQKGGKR